MRKKLLIVGGTGFIGYHLAKKCLLKSYSITSLSYHKPKKKRFLNKIKYLECNISKKDLLKKKLKDKFDYVVNLGGYVNHKEKIKTYNTHYIGCKNLADIFLKKKINSFIQIGSCVEYGFNKSPQKENTITKVNDIKSTYGQAKLLATNYLINLYKEKKFPCKILRFYMVYGPRQDANRLIPTTIKSCLLDKKFPCSSGNQLRDFLYVDDAVSAIIKCLENSNLNGKIFNFGSGVPYKVKDIIELIKNKISLGKPIYGKIKLRKDEIKILYPNISEAKKKLNWKPTVSIKDGINLTINNFKKDIK